MLWGGELVLRDGVAVGQVTSAAYATTTGACVGLAYIRTDALDGAWTINVGGRPVPVTVSRKAPYDPENLRIRA